MSIRDAFRAAAKSGQTVFQSVFSSTRFAVVASSVYDASSGVASAISSSVMTSVLFGSYMRSEIDGDKVRVTDVKGMMVQSNMTFRPETRHTAHRVEAGVSVEYEVRNVAEDPANALWTIQLRGV